MSDWEAGDLKLMEVSGEEFVGSTIEHRFKSAEDGEDYWYAY